MSKKITKNVILFVLPIVILYLFFFLRATQVLPQGAINLLPEIEEPKESDTIIVFSPHQDDETIACGGYIIRAVKNHSKIYVVLITDGNRRGKKLVRMREFENATSILGLSKDNLIFLNFPDGKLMKYKDKLLESFYDIIEKYKPNIVFIPASFDNHKDHKTSSEVLREILVDFKEVKVYEYLVHHDYFPQPLKFNPNLYLLPPLKTLNFHSKWFKFSLNSEEINLKKEAVFTYRSQLKEPPLKEMLPAFIRLNEIFYFEY